MLITIRSALGRCKRATLLVKSPIESEFCPLDMYPGIIIGGVGRHLPEVIETDGPGGVVIFLKVTTPPDEHSPSLLNLPPGFGCCSNPLGHLSRLRKAVHPQLLCPNLQCPFVQARRKGPYGSCRSLGLKCGSLRLSSLQAVCIQLGSDDPWWLVRKPDSVLYHYWIFQYPDRFHDFGPPHANGLESPRPKEE